MSRLEKLAQEYRDAELASDKARLRLYAAIRAAHTAGQSFGAIAAETVLSRARVHQVCSEGTR